MVAFSTVATPLGQVKIVHAIENSSSQNANKNENFVYLSDIKYEEESKTSYGEIQKDKNTDKRIMQIKIKDEALEVDKGIGAHADSTIIYNLSDYTNKYSRFVTYLAVDSSYSGKGTGVGFKISKSDDGQHWEELAKVDRILASDNAELIDVDIANAKYLKLEADDLGDRTADHAIYANAMLVKEGYKVEHKETKNILTVAEYDKALQSKSVDENIKSNKNIILKREFVKQIGYQNLQKLYHQDNKYKDSIDYLFNNEKALEYFIAGGGIAKGGRYIDSFKSFADIYEKYSEDLNDSKDNQFNLRLAISVSLAYGNTGLVRFWAGGNAEVNAVKRYETYQELVKSGIMDKAGNTENSAKWSTQQFKDLTIPLMVWVVDSRMNEDEFEWLADYALDQKEKKRDFLSAYNYINYGWGYNYGHGKFYSDDNKKTYNDKYNFEEYYDTYGNRSIRRLWMVFEDGSVCGGLAKTYANLAETFGRPSSGLGQPGHAATETYMYNNKTKQYEWILQNNISGWAKSGNEFNVRLLNWGNKSWNRWHSASYVALATDAIETEEAFAKYRQATVLNLLANSYTDLKTKEDIYEKALSIQNINLDSYEGLVNTYKANNEKTSSDYYKLAERVTNTYTYYPLVMHELNTLIKPNLTSVKDKANFDVITTNALNKAKVATRENVKQPDICITMAKSLTNEVTAELATFSFNGDNANTIVINSDYKDSEIMVRYSFDSGKTWTNTNKHSIKLTSDEIAKINENDNIRVGLVGTEDYHTIDIKKGAKPNNNSLFKNDSENRVIGSTNNLEYSYNGTDWSDYKDDTRFNDTVTVKLRYKANGTSLQSDITEYSFVKNTDTDDNKYITLDNIIFKEASSQQSNSNQHKSTNIVDGNDNTAWHTRYSGDKDRFFIVEFKDVKYLSSVDYIPAGVNGRLKTAEIETSLDGKTWTKAGKFTGLKNDGSVKNMKLEKPVQAKFVKVIGKETYGNYQPELNKYFSGKDVRFYEDLTAKANGVVSVQSKIIQQDNAETVTSENTTIKPTENKNIETKNVTNENTENKEAGASYVESPIIYTDNNSSTTNNAVTKEAEANYVESPVTYIDNNSSEANNAVTKEAETNYVESPITYINNNSSTTNTATSKEVGTSYVQSPITYIDNNSSETNTATNKEVGTSYVESPITYIDNN